VSTSRRFLLLGIALALVAAFVVVRVVDRGVDRRTIDLVTFEHRLDAGRG